VKLQRIQTVCLLFATSLAVSASAMAQNSLIDQRPFDQFNSWKFWGGNIVNSHSNPFEKKLNPGNVSGLTMKWAFSTGGNVSATPTVENDVVYCPDWGGNLFKLDGRTGKLLWSHKISEYTGIATSLSRNSPAIVGNLLIFGDQASATVMAVNKYSGELVWKNVIDSTPNAIITNSPVEFDGRVYVGTSSFEEDLAGSDPHLALQVRGRVASLDAHSGKLLWQSFMVPEGYTGGSTWGSTFAIDVKRHSLYVTTGNNHSVPADLNTCLQQAGSDPIKQQQCLSPQNYIDAVLSLDLYTGKVKWAHLTGADDWILTCFIANPSGLPCPVPAGEDSDFGSGPNLFTVNKNGQEIDYVGAGQKNGVYWALDPDDGSYRWATLVGPGSVVGGIQWGSAVEGNTIYVAVVNGLHKTVTLPPDGKQTTNGGLWAALDAATGKVLWEIPASGTQPGQPGVVAEAFGQMTAANGVVYAASFAGDMVAIEGTTGKILWKFSSGVSVICGPSVVNGTVYWGAGYTRGSGIGGNKIYAFSLP
jgi:polyvinyl alcohol dehydrogenase (cytochrome)